MHEHVLLFVMPQKDVQLPLQEPDQLPELIRLAKQLAISVEPMRYAWVVGNPNCKDDLWLTGRHSRKLERSQESIRDCSELLRVGFDEHRVAEGLYSTNHQCVWRLSR